jgi:hypothetical protein
MTNELVEDKIKIDVPYNGWRPRPHQKKLWRYLMSGGKRAVAVWHRRAGKDEVALHATAVAMTERPANYWHMLPQFEQGRRSIWTAINPHTGKRRIDEAFPHEIRANTNDSTMFIRHRNGSTWSVVGSDAVSSGSGLGASVAGIVFSEFALANPSAWGFYRPILEENQGWAAFISTPRGRNHMHQLFLHSQSAPGWFSELLTVKDTDALTDAQLAESLKEYRALFGHDQGQAMYDQELMCSWNASVLGSFYAREMMDVRDQKRVIEFEHEPDYLVHRAWDLGVKDDTSIWWFQVAGAQLLILDHLATSGVGVEWYADEIEKRRKKYGWRDGTDWVPTDAKVRDFGTGKTRVETMQLFGLHPQVAPAATFQDGINAVRRTLPLCVFHPRTEETGINALEQYRREWDDEKKTFRASHVHDWTSHPADAFRYLSLAWRTAPRREAPAPKDTGWHIPPPVEERGGIRL